jgi:ribonuclease R
MAERKGKRAAAGRRDSARAGPADVLPTREEILAFIADQPERVGKREIARAFKLRPGSRIALKRLLREMADDGLIEKRGRRLGRAGEVPAVAVLEITERDSDGELLARPTDWDEEAFGPAPLFLVEAPRSGPEAVVPGMGDRILARVSPDLEEDEEDEDAEEAEAPRRTARVMRVLAKRPQRVLGVLERLEDGSFRVQPTDKKARASFLVDEQDLNGAEPGALVAVEPIRGKAYGLPRARVAESIADLKSEKAVSLIALHAHDIPHVFPPAVLADAEAAQLPGPQGRTDLTQLPFVTIDPADAKDHDDAVYAEADEAADNPGGMVLWVAIADVSSVVPPGSAMDREALTRGNSVYFPDRVVPMLPERISNNLCSLREGEPRPVLVIRMTYGADGAKRGQKVLRATIRSAASLSYQQAQAAIDGEADKKAAPLLDNALRPLWAGYDILKRGREARRPLELDLPERKILLKPDGTVDRVVVPPRLDAHRLIEEYMIAANVAAAEVLESKRSGLLYRVHDQPSLAKLESLREFLASLDMSMPKTGNLRPAHFNQILERVVDTPHAQLVNEVVLRSQSQAEYGAENYGHFGLNLRRYAHFTSPIRRYADLIVHRALVRALGLGEGGLPDGVMERLPEIGAQISAAERRAMAAERETVDRLIAGYLADRIGATFEGRISGVTRAGLFVRLSDTGADGFIPVATLENDFYRHDEARHALIGDRTGEAFQLGDTVEVRLVEAQPVAGALRFELLSEGRRLSGGAGPSGKRGRRRAEARAETTRRGKRARG